MRFADETGEAAVIRTDADLFAIDNICPHADAALHEGHLDGERLHCPWHGWRFHVRTGHCDVGALFDIPVYPVKEAEGFIWIDLDAGATVEREEDEEEGFYF